MTDKTEGPDLTERPATPWWVKVIGIAVLIVLIVAAIILVVGGGRHGPGMHGSAGAVGRPVAMARFQVEAASNDFASR